MRTLNEIYLDNCTHGNEEYGDKGTRHSYINEYEKMLEPYRLTTGNILEIGVAQGHSIRMWEEYFPNAKIFGMDIVIPDIKFDRAYMIQANSTIESEVVPLLDTLKLEFDIIIDDGSHNWEDQYMTFGILRPYFKELYIIEDVSNTLKLARQLITYKSVGLTIFEFFKNGQADDVLFKLKRTGNG